MLPKKSIFPTNPNDQKIISSQNDIELSAIEDSSRQEFCQNSEDVKNAETTARIIRFTSKKTGDIVADIEIPKTEIVTIYYNFIKNEPITIIEKDYLLEFLLDEKGFKIAQKIFSKLLLLQGDENNEFINSFLKNSNGNLDITQFVDYLIKSLKNYKIVLPKNIEKIENIGETKEGKYYSYILEGKIGTFIVKDNEIFCLNGTFESIKILKNGIIFAVKENIIINRDFEKPYEKKVGIFYIFDGHHFNEFYKRPGIIDIKKIGGINYTTTGENGKKGLLEIEEIIDDNQNNNYEITNIFDPKYDKVDIRSKFILTLDKLSDSQYKLLVHINAKNGMNTLLEEICNDFNYSDKKGRILDFQIIFNENYLKIDTIKGSNIYKYDETTSIVRGDGIYKYKDTNSTLKVVPGLEGVETFGNLIRLFDGIIPSYIKYKNGKGGIYIFNKETGILTCLFEDKKNKLRFNNPKFSGDLLGIDNKINNKIISNFNPYFFWKDGILYEFKKGYNYDLDMKGGYGYIKKGLFGKKIYLGTKFEEIQEYLEPATLPIIIK